MANNKLFRRSSFFIDVMNVLIYSDLFIYHEIKARLEQENDEYMVKTLFKKSFPKINAETRELEDMMVINLCAKKTNQNILLDWIDKEVFESEESLSTYVSLLYLNIFENPICDEYMQITEFGNTIKLLMMDENLNKITAYLPFATDELISNIRELFSGSTKLELAIGNKNELLKEINYDSYVFENISDVDKYLRKGSSKLIEVLIPTYEFNMIEDRTNVDRLLEQVTYHKLKLEHPASDYHSKYNLSINTIGIPI